MPKPTPTPKEFVSRIEPHLSALFRAAYRLSGSTADAEDLVQETCLRAFAKDHAFADSRSPRAWLLRVQYHLFVDGTRRAEQRRVDMLASDPDFLAIYAPARSAEDDDDGELLAAWSRLTKEQRALLALRAEGYSPAEISAITGIETDALNARLYRARQSLARYLQGGAAAPLPCMEKRR